MPMRNSTAILALTLALLTAGPANAWTRPPVTWDNYWRYGGKDSVDDVIYMMYRYRLCVEYDKPLNPKLNCLVDW